MANAQSLIQFCGTDNPRFDAVCMPHVIGEFAYATDTKALFRLPTASLGKFPDVAGELTAKYWKNFPLENPVLLADVVNDLPPELYRRYDDDNDSVTFTVVVEDDQTWTKLQGFQGEYMTHYMRKIKQLPNVLVKEIQIASAFVLLWECSGGGQGVLLGKNEK